MCYDSSKPGCLIDTSLSMAGTTYIMAQSVWWTDQPFYGIDINGRVWVSDRKDGHWSDTTRTVDFATGQMSLPNRRLKRKADMPWDHIFAGGPRNFAKVARTACICLLDDGEGVRDGNIIDPHEYRVISDHGHVGWWRAATKEFTQATAIPRTELMKEAAAAVIAAQTKAEEAEAALAAERSALKNQIQQNDALRREVDYLRAFISMIPMNARQDALRTLAVSTMTDMPKN